MKIVRWFFYILLPIILLGTYIQAAKSFPDYFTPDFDEFLQKLTVVSILLAIVIACYFFFMKSRNREGFAEQDASVGPMDTWREMVSKYSLQDLCKLIGEMEAKMIPAEKGVPPDQKTDAQAREAVQQEFLKGNAVGLFSCDLFQKVQAAQDIDQFFTVLQEVPDTFFAEAHSTANVALNLLLKQKQSFDDALKNPTKEGFRDVSTKVCSPDIVEQRRKFLREQKLSQEAEQCLLPEEVPNDSKESVVRAKLKKLEATYLEYLAYLANKKSSRPPFVKAPGMERIDNKLVSTEELYPLRNQAIDKILEQANIVRIELEQAAKKTESGEIVSEIQTS